MRLFTAIDLPTAAKSEVQALCFGLPNMRWVKPEQIHLTLVFLGETNPAALGEIQECLAQIRFAPFPLRCQGIGSFRSGVLWLGTEPHPELLRLEAAIRRQLANVPSLLLERRKFVPHITLGRFDRRHPPSLESYLNTHNLTRIDLKVDHFELFASQLTGKGAIHQSLQRIEATPVDAPDPSAGQTPL